MTNAEVLHQVEHGYRMPSPPGCPPSLYDIMLECWKKVGKGKPFMIRPPLLPTGLSSTSFSSLPYPVQLCCISALSSPFLFNPRSAVSPLIRMVPFSHISLLIPSVPILLSLPYFLPSALSSSRSSSQPPATSLHRFSSSSLLRTRWSVRRSRRCNGSSKISSFSR